ncbi:hypothetical protein A5881_002965 [Enterococcus termitis]|nr:hypothetical protein A5881_002379 [Enterococcus termitis]
MAKLTEKQRAFAEEYVLNFGNGTQAAIKAGYSKKTARVIAKENLTKPNIQEYIKKITAQANQERIMSVEEALSISAAIARGQPMKYEFQEFDPETNEVVNAEKKAFSAGIKERNQALEHIYKANMVFEKPEDSKNADAIEWAEMVAEAEQELGAADG